MAAVNVTIKVDKSSKGKTVIVDTVLISKDGAREAIAAVAVRGGDELKMAVDSNHELTIRTPD